MVAVVVMIVMMWWEGRERKESNNVWRGRGEGKPE